MKHCLVIGASGLIGLNLVRKLCRDNYVYGVSRTNIYFISDRYKHINMDISNENEFHLLPDKVDIIINLSNSSYFRTPDIYAKKIFDVNVLSTLLLLEYAKKKNVKTFILASSGGVYGRSAKPFEEKDSYTQKPSSLGFYLTTKICSEVLTENYNSYMNIIIVRPFFVYGPKQNKEMLIPRLVNSVLNNMIITLDSKNGISINPLYVSDAVDAIEKIVYIDRSLKINIGGSEIINIRNICNIIGEILSKQPIFSISNNVEIDKNDIIGDITLMRELLVEPKVKIYDGLKSVCKDMFF